MDIKPTHSYWSDLTSEMYDDIDIYLLKWMLHHSRTQYEIYSKYRPDMLNVTLKCMIYFWGETRGPNLWALPANTVISSILKQMYIPFTLESDKIKGIKPTSSCNLLRGSTDKYVFIYDNMLRNICIPTTPDLDYHLDPCSLMFPNEVLSISDESRLTISTQLQAISRGVRYKNQPDEVDCFLLRTGIGLTEDKYRSDLYLISTLLCSEGTELMEIPLDSGITILSVVASSKLESSDLVC